MNRLVVLAVAALAFATLFVLFWRLPGDVGVDAWTLAFTLWQAMPFGLLLLFHRRGLSDVGAMLTAFVVSGLYVWGYVEIERSDSSTAAIGLLYLPAYFVLVVMIAWIVDLGARRVLSRLKPPS